MPTIAPIACTAKFRRSTVVTFAALTLAASVSSGFARRLEPSVADYIAQNETAPSDAPAAPGPTQKVPTPTTAEIAITKWQQSLVAHLTRFKSYPHASAAAGVVSLAFTIDRKGNLVSSRIEKTSGSDVLDAEALAMVKRAAPFPAPPAGVADSDVTFVVPIRFSAGEKH
jgi:periplasmic protein TonB